MYEKMKRAILAKSYTLTEATEYLNIFLTTGQITSEQFTELFELAKDLPVNGEKEDQEIQADTFLKEWEEYKAKVDTLWNERSETVELEPEPEEPDGTKENPIVATNNMQYYNGKYYTYNGVLYLCNRDTEIPVWHTPDLLVGHYFEIVEG